jgi:hypothetical protein
MVFTRHLKSDVRLRSRGAGRRLFELQVARRGGHRASGPPLAGPVEMPRLPFAMPNRTFIVRQVWIVPSV